jgi:hypothetical protein
VFATMTLILGVVGDAQIQPYNENVLGTAYIYNVRPCAAAPLRAVHDGSRCGGRG